MMQQEKSGGGAVDAPRTPPRGAMRALLFSLALTFAALGAIAVICAQTGIHFSHLTRDTREAFVIPFYHGAVSDLGILVWSSTAAVCFFAATFPAPDPKARARGRFLLVSGLMTAWLALDDLLTLHEVVIPSALHVRQRYVLAAYAAGMLFYLFHFRKLILQMDGVILVASLFFLGISVLSDAVQARDPLPSHHYVEDGSKLVGLVAWSLYFFRVSRIQVSVRPALGGGA